MVFTNFTLKANENTEMSNGATRTVLKVVNKTGKDIEANVPFEAKVGTLFKGNHAFVFLNEGSSDKDLWVMLSGGYGVEFHGSDLQKEILFEAHSVGGYGNSASTLAVLRENVMIIHNSYKNRSTSSYEKTTKDGFTKLSPEDAILELYGDQVTEL